MTKETTNQTYKRTILFDIKENEDKEYYYFSLYCNGVLFKRAKGKDYYKTKDKIIDFARYTLGVNLF